MIVVENTGDEDVRVTNLYVERPSGTKDYVESVWVPATIDQGGGLSGWGYPALFQSGSTLDKGRYTVYVVWDLGTLTIYFWVSDVGGVVVSIDEVGLLAPYIGLVSTIIIATVVTVVYGKRVWRRRERQ